MSRVKPKWRLLAIVLAVVGFLVAFGVALAATVQVSNSVPSSVSVVEAQVIGPENLVLSHDDAGLNLVTALSFELVKLQPPLETRDVGQRIFIKNASANALTIIGPCQTVFDNDVEVAGGEIGFMNVSIRTLGTETHRGEACGENVAIAPGETVIADVHVCCFEPGLTIGAHNFTAVFGAIGTVP